MSARDEARDRAALEAGKPLEERTSASPKEPVDYFLAENPFADAAVDCARKINDVGAREREKMLALAQVNATLAVAYEQRQSAHHLEAAIINHAQETRTD